MKTSEKLKLVRDFLEKPENWIKGSYTKGNACWLVGAMMERIPQTETYGEEADIVSNVIKQLAAQRPEAKQYNHRGMVTGFNDDPLTTHADVLEVLDIAIKDAKEQGR